MPQAARLGFFATFSFHALTVRAILVACNFADAGQRW